jgi:hypothetical protein
MRSDSSSDGGAKADTLACHSKVAHDNATRAFSYGPGTIPRMAQSPHLAPPPRPLTNPFSAGFRPPNPSSPSTKTLNPGAIVVWDKLGSTVFKAVASKEGMADSEVCLFVCDKNWPLTKSGNQAWYHARYIAYQ